MPTQNQNPVWFPNGPRYKPKPSRESLGREFFAMPARQAESPYDPSWRQCINCGTWNNLYADKTCALCESNNWFAPRKRGL